MKPLIGNSAKTTSEDVKRNLPPKPLSNVKARNKLFLEISLKKQRKEA